MTDSSIFEIDKPGLGRLWDMWSCEKELTNSIGGFMWVDRKLCSPLSRLIEWASESICLLRGWVVSGRPGGWHKNVEWAVGGETDGYLEMFGLSVRIKGDTWDWVGEWFGANSRRDRVDGWMGLVWKVWWFAWWSFEISNGREADCVLIMTFSSGSTTRSAPGYLVGWWWRSYCPVSLAKSWFPPWCCGSSGGLSAKSPTSWGASSWVWEESTVARRGWRDLCAKLNALIHGPYATVGFLGPLGLARLVLLQLLSEWPSFPQL